jgi:hypothetical protein
MMAVGEATKAQMLGEFRKHPLQHALGEVVKAKHVLVTDMAGSCACSVNRGGHY